MFDDALITLWSLWPVILFWVLLALLILGFVLAGLHLRGFKFPTRQAAMMLGRKRPLGCLCLVVASIGG